MTNKRRVAGQVAFIAVTGPTAEGGCGRGPRWTRRAAKFEYIETPDWRAVYRGKLDVSNHNLHADFTLVRDTPHESVNKTLTSNYMPIPISSEDFPSRVIAL